MSLLNKSWRVLNSDPGASLLQKLLANRGLNDEAEMNQFFHPSAERDFHDPFLLKDMDKAVKRIGKAIKNEERILIFGDYDVDGITGTAILMRALTTLGAKVSYRLPHRIEDGYGLSEKYVREAKKLDVKIIVTVDNGISCAGEVSIANELGIDVILTDHHTVPEKIPEAFAILHPKVPGEKYPFIELTGAGVALKFAQALFSVRIKDEAVAKEETEKLLDLACMGTIADVGELKGENRYIVKLGLLALENTRWPGLSRLKESAGVKGKMDTHDIGFLLGPRINAAGRISHPAEALRLLLHDGDQGGLLAEALERLNRKRQKLTESTMAIAEEMAKACANEPVVMLHHPEFHGGIIGLLAAKLSEKFGRPAIIMECRGERLVGSCRSIPGVNVVEALKKASKYLSHFGGHAAAAGFDLRKENLDGFHGAIRAHFETELKKVKPATVLDVDAEISKNDISEKTLQILEWFEPFGAGNPKPKFLCRDLTLERVSTVGSQKRHLKLTAEKEGTRYECMWFGMAKFTEKLRRGTTFDTIFELERNEWNGKITTQLKIVDIALNS